MGTDQAPVSEVAGAVGALRDYDSGLEILLVGDQKKIRRELSNHADYPEDRLQIVHAPERINSSDSPAAAVRRKRESSIVVGIKLHQEGEADAFVSAGSTGAVMAASLFFLRRLPGVDRPAIGTVLPTATGPTLMLDAGANVDCKPHHLVQFAHLGKIYAQDLMGVHRPRVGLLNIGEEPEKGNELVVETHRMLQGESTLHFVGNVEGREIIRGACDVLVCDGFSGNLLLKFYESVAGFVIGLLKREVEHSAVDLNFEEVFRVLDYSEIGGAPLLGVNGISIISHGESTPKAIRNALGVAAQAVSSSMVTHVARELALGVDATEGVE